MQGLWVYSVSRLSQTSKFEFRDLIQSLITTSIANVMQVGILHKCVPLALALENDPHPCLVYLG
jgi:hypothetical protein